MTKTIEELKSIIKTAQAEIDRLEAEKPSQPDRLVVRPEASRDSMPVVGMTASGDGFKLVGHCRDSSGESWKFAFPTDHAAREHAKALNTFYELLAHPLRVPVTGEVQETIELLDNMTGIKAETWSDLANKPFGAYTDAQAVINVVGADRILHMRKTLMWVGGGE